MARSPVAKVYAKALFELAEEKSKVSEMQQEFLGFLKVLKTQPDLEEALSAYSFSVEERRKLASELLSKAGANDLFKSFIDLVIKKNRLPAMYSAYEEFQKLVDKTNNVVRGKVTTVEPLSDSERNDLSKTFGRRFGKEVVLEQVVQKDILGGLVVDIQGLTFDGSLKTTIRQLKENLERQSL